MKAIADVWPTIVSFRNLERAAKRAAAGKRGTAGVARFLFRLEPELLALQRELLDGSYRPSVPFLFEIKDPKPRTIAAAPFRDRVVHHALIDPIERELDHRLVDQSLACRRGKGQHRALRYAQRLVRRSEWFLKLDVKSFFPSLRHDVVLDTLRAVIADAKVMALCETIVRSGGDAGFGLPIGNLTSQWFANLVLGRLDHHVLTVLRPAGYVRYMDDFVLFAGDKFGDATFAKAKESLQAMHGEVAAFLATTLQLVLKPSATILSPVTQGLPFLGFRVYRSLRRLRPQNLARTRSRLRHRGRQLRDGAISEQQYADSVRAVVAHLRHGNTLRLLRTMFAGDAGNEAADPFLRQSLQPRRQLPEPGRQRSMRQSQQQRTVDPQQRPGLAPRQDVASPDRVNCCMASTRSAP